MKRAAPMLLPGMLFGAGLGVSGMTNPAKVIGFLDLTGSWDPSLALVMVGAIASFATLYALIRQRPAPILGGKMPGPPTGGVDGRLLLGAALFGIGWGLGGLCPGPALTNLGAMRIEALAFIPAMALGMILAQRVFGADS
jgi:uncharacterized membrane protein YedE/YeeE